MPSMRGASALGILFVSAAAGLCACSGRYETTGPADGHSSGGAGADNGGSAGAEARRAQGNLRLNVHYADPALCPVTGKTYVVGDPQGPSSVAPGDRLIDGEHGATIKCSVRGRGPFEFSASIEAASSESDQVSLTFSQGLIDANGQTGSATLRVLTPQLGTAFTSAARGCALHVVNSQIKPGSIWATFSCDAVYPFNLGVCSIGAVSAFALENCDEK